MADAVALPSHQSPEPVAIDTSLLAMLGFPTWALVANSLVRHYYGEFIHADLPWMYGRFTSLFVSPVMHRWHHARDVTGNRQQFRDDLLSLRP